MLCRCLAFADMTGVCINDATHCEMSIETPTGYVICRVLARGLPVKLRIQRSSDDADPLRLVSDSDGDCGRCGWCTTSPGGRFDGEDAEPTGEE